MKKILLVVGALRAGSFNQQLAQQIEVLLAGKAEVSYLEYATLPVLNQDLETPVLPVVQGLRDQLRAADLLWIVSPVYNHMIPGGVKNLLDWLSRATDASVGKPSAATFGKKATVSSFAFSGHEHLFQQYQQLLPFIQMEVVGAFTAVGADAIQPETGKIVLAEAKLEELKKQVEAVLEA